MAKTSLVQDMQLEEYQERFSEHFVMKRDGGILEIRMHTENEEAKWSKELHRALPQIFQIAGADRKNEVIILTGTGDYWLREFDQESWAEIENGREEFAKANYDFEYLDAHKLCENLLWNIDVPLISAINGPGFHTEFSSEASSSRPKQLRMCRECGRLQTDRYPYVLGTNPNNMGVTEQPMLLHLSPH